MSTPCTAAVGGAQVERLRRGGVCLCAWWWGWAHCIGRGDQGSHQACCLASYLQTCHGPMRFCRPAAAQVIDFLAGADPEAAKRAKSRYRCFDRWGRGKPSHGLAKGFPGSLLAPSSCSSLLHRPCTPTSHQDVTEKACAVPPAALGPTPWLMHTLWGLAASPPAPMPPSQPCERCWRRGQAMGEKGRWLACAGDAAAVAARSARGSPQP